MTLNETPAPRFSKSRRSKALLASAAALGIGIGIGIGTADLYRGPTSLVGAAQAAQPAEAGEAMPQASGFADLVAKVKPAVISVRVQLQETAATDNDQHGGTIQPGSPFDRFFKQFGFQNMPNGTQQMPRRHSVQAEGSGFFISPDGYAVTNNHVVDHAKTVQITTDDGRTMPAKVVGTDPKTDLALVKVDGSNFPYVKFADHNPRIGDWVVAVGNPFGLGGTVTAGVVSAQGRDIGEGPYDDFIQIDAPINKGNSGGPAFDVSGNVIGVNTAIFSPSGGSVGIGFDIPADTAKRVVEQLKEHGHVTRGWIGVQVQAVTPDIAQALGMKKARGALVDESQPDSPAAKAGIVAGDVITSVNGKDVKDSRELARQIAAEAPGTKVSVAVLHDGGEKTVSMTLGTLPNEQEAKAEAESPSNSANAPRLGLTLAPAAEVDGVGHQCVAVTAVDPDGPAAQHGIQSGDVILDVAGKAVSKPADVREQLSELRKAGKQAALMRMKSGQETKFVAVPLGKAA
jgi:serine protease Do